MKLNNKGFGFIAVILFVAAIALVSITGYSLYNKHTSNKSTEASTDQDAEVVNEGPVCESKPIAGKIIFDIAQPAPFTDPRVNKIKEEIAASHLTWRDGRIIKIDGKDHSSGKYIATVEIGTEESAMKMLKDNPDVTFASQAKGTCPTETRVKVE